MKRNISFDDQIAAIPEERQKYIQKRVQVAAGVRRLLEKLQMTQRELANRAGFQESYISRILQGDNLTLETIAKLEIALGADLLVVPQVHISKSTKKLQRVPKKMKYAKSEDKPLRKNSAVAPKRVHKKVMAMKPPK